jgi:hypothetical protein
MGSSDFRTTSLVRSTLARHWIDLKKVTVGCFRGTVRLTGELTHLAGESEGHHHNLQPSLLETEVRAVQGVERVYFDISNWDRNDSGEWSARGNAGARATTVAPHSAPTIEVVGPGNAARKHACAGTVKEGR